MNKLENLIYHSLAPDLKKNCFMLLHIDIYSLLPSNLYEHYKDEIDFINGNITGSPKELETLAVREIASKFYYEGTFHDWLKIYLPPNWKELKIENTFFFSYYEVYYLYSDEIYMEIVENGFGDEYVKMTIAERLRKAIELVMERKY